LWLGVLLVLGSVLVGAKLLSAADETVPVWQVDRDVRAGLPLSGDDVRSTRVHFDDEQVIGGYLPADEPLPEGVRATRDLADGELLTRSALAAGHADVPPQLPLGVGEAGLPVDLAVGDRVDVWAVPPPDSDVGEPSRVLTAVSVASLAEGGTGGDRQVLVTLAGETDVGEVLRALNGSSVVLVRVGV
jgi:hypothetical protein